MCRREERNKGICINIGRLPNPIGEKVRKMYVHRKVSEKRQTNRKKEGGKEGKDSKRYTKWRIGKISETKKNYFLVQ